MKLVDITVLNAENNMPIPKEQHGIVTPTSEHDCVLNIPGKLKPGNYTIQMTFSDIPSMSFGITVLPKTLAGQVLRFAKSQLIKLYNALLPNHFDVDWHINLGRLGITFLSISLDYLERPGYWPKDERVYRPEINVLRLSWHGRNSGGSFDRMLMGYHLELDDNMKEHVKGAPYETWYWHNFYFLFRDFSREADGPIKLHIKP